MFNFRTQKYGCRIINDNRLAHLFTTNCKGTSIYNMGKKGQKKTAIDRSPRSMSLSTTSVHWLHHTLPDYRKPEASRQAPLDLCQWSQWHGQYSHTCCHSYLWPCPPTLAGTNKGVTPQQTSKRGRKVPIGEQWTDRPLESCSQLPWLHQWKYSIHPKLKKVWLFDTKFNHLSYLKKLCKISFLLLWLDLLIKVL